MRKNTRYIASLDGLRAFAVLAVIAYHMDFSWAGGGLLGVTMFFVLSGYLITGLLIGEFRESKTVDLLHFWLRRVRRLVPAIITVVVVTCALCVVFNHELLTKMRPDIAPSLLFYSNWWQIFHDISYFEALGSPSPLQHFWSLAIEEQFYLVWPVLLLILFKRRTKFSTIKRGILVGIALSVTLMAVLYSPDADPSRVYFGTDTRAFSLLIGAWLAFAWPSTAFQGMKPLDRSEETQNIVRILDVVGVVAFVGLVLLVCLSNGYDAFPYRGGLLLCSVLTALIIADIVHPYSLFAKVWAASPLVWIGKRSYGMYLWHFPILVLLTDPNSTSGSPLWLNAIELALIVGVSAFSYTFIEDPVRKGKLEEWVRRVRAGEVSVAGWLATHVVPAVAAVAVTAVALVGTAVVPDKVVDYVGNGGVELTEEEAQAQTQQTAQTAAAEKKVYDVLLIGDSVSVRCEPIFEDYFPEGCIDAVVGRQMSQAQETYDFYKERDVVGKTVIICLGNNAVLTSDQLDTLLADIGPDKTVFLTNTCNTTDYMQANNQLIEETAEKNSNVSVIDWYSYAVGNDAYFEGDGTHLTLDGAEYYMQLISEAVQARSTS